MEDYNKEDDKDMTIEHPVESCPRSYKPWIWTIVIMAVLTLGWATYESYQKGSIVRKLIESDDYKKMAKGKMSGFYNTAGATYAKGKISQKTYHDVIDAVRPALVGIDVAVGGAQNIQAPDPNNLNNNNVNPNEGEPTVNYTRIGSGVIIEPSGYVLSSYHVVSGAVAMKATVYIDEGARDYQLKIVNVDKENDLALLRLQGPGPFPYALLGDSNNVKTGDFVLAMGSPYGFDQTITNGIISSRNRTITIGGRVYEDMLQTDASINKGNSGGPLVNLDGEIIGINTAIYSPMGRFSGIAFAVPIAKASELVAGVVDFKNAAVPVAGGQLVAWQRSGRQVGNIYKLPNGQIITPPHPYRGKCLTCHPQLCVNNGVPGNMPAMGQQGPIQQVVANQQAAQQANTNDDPFLGVVVQSVDTVIADHNGMIHPTGVLVDRVYPRTTSEAAGLQRGDIILRVDGRRVSTPVEFKQELTTKKIGAKFDFEVLRNKATIKIKVKTDQQPPFLPDRKIKQVREFVWLGSEFQPLKQPLAFYVKNGVFAADIEGVLAKAGLMRGDIIVGINKMDVDDMASFIEITGKLKPNKGILLDVLRSGEFIYITVGK
ncbi:MAG: trypsin-like peptidase domain-containing protein [Nitrospirae bacterium]|uniref:Magnetosome protein MamE n=1 Tax=uncultured Nitrospirota bacterium TaxID=170969 RepID=A0A142BTX5_9BACT|nr:magnetosome protein MamE [uncultured Nitrospirota bacterium]MBF0343182.1 trypsin-like peptidase domain-containing protein [Nitrospirota bacterium]